MTTETNIQYTERAATRKLSDITADKEFNIRKKLNGLEELASSIKELGQTTPVLVTEDNKLVWGFRRFAALQLLDPDGEILCDVVSETDANRLILLNVQENVSREQLTLSEEYEAVARLSTFMSKEQICETLGVTKTWVSQRLKLGELSDELREAVDNGLSTRAAASINLLPEDQQSGMIEEAYGMPVSQVAERVQNALDVSSAFDTDPSESDDDIELLELDDDETVEPVEDDIEELPEEDAVDNRLYEWLKSAVSDDSMVALEAIRSKINRLGWADELVAILETNIDVSEEDGEED